MILYSQLVQAEFLSRPNRFIAYCRLHGEIVVCHVKNTGRCKELLVSGCKVYLAPSDQPARKTHFDLVCVENHGYVVNIDSQAPNRVFAEWALAGSFLPELTNLRPEVCFGSSRFDFAYRCHGAPGFAEVKGVTLFDDTSMAYFPDAPTERGIKHVYELIAARREGYDAALCFVLARNDVAGVQPNDVTHPAFGDALEEARAAGVRLIGAVCCVTPESMVITHTVPVILSNRRRME